MRNLVRYTLIAILALMGSLALLMNFANDQAARLLAQAVNCDDTTSVRCYQLVPGVITKVSVTKVGGGQQDAVTIATAGKEVQTFLQVRGADTGLVRVGADVTVEVWNGSPVAVTVAGRAIPTTASPASDHSVFVYMGLVMLWIAATFLAVSLVNRRIAAAVGAFSGVIDRRAARALQAARRGDGYLIRPRIQDGLMIPVAVGVIALLSGRLFFTPGLRVIAIAGDVLVLGPIVVRTLLSLRNGRLEIDQACVRFVDWLGRAESWPLAQIDRAAIVSVRLADLGVPSVVFTSRGETELCNLTSVMWNVRVIAAACQAVGIVVEIGRRPDRGKGINWSRQAERLIVLLPAVVMLVLSVIPIRR